MAKRTLKASLSTSGTEQLRKQLQEYKIDLENKCRELAERLSKIGLDIAAAKVRESPLGKYITLTSSISADRMGCKGVILAKGQVMEHENYAPFSIILAVEFGAGIHYNSAANPKADEFGYGVGTFPGQVHAFDPGGWYYWDESSQSWKHSYGVKATMPMYSADMEVINNVAKVAREVFG